jgi:hypothetical protein
MKDYPLQTVDWHLTTSLDGFIAGPDDRDGSTLRRSHSPADPPRLG